MDVMKNKQGNKPEPKEIAVKEDLQFAVIRINEVSDDSDPTNVYVRCTEGKFMLQRGEYIPVPMGVVESLLHATKPKQIRKVRDGKVEVTYMMIPRFGFSLARKIGENLYNDLRTFAKERSLTESEVYGG